MITQKNAADNEMNDLDLILVEDECLKIIQQWNSAKQSLFTTMHNNEIHCKEYWLKTLLLEQYWFEKCMQKVNL